MVKEDQAYFQGKTAVVTGAASGIGLALVEALLARGAKKVVMADINPQRLAEQEKRLEAQYAGRVKGFRCDVTAAQHVQSLMAEASAFFAGPFDLLINNAGALFSGWFEEVTDEEWKKAFDLNFYGAVYGMRAALPLMKKQGGGQIVNIISGTAFTPMPEWSPYAATKAALCALTLAARAEYWDDHIKISAATPGTTATHIFGDFQTPEGAQSPALSAERILHGAAVGDRLSFGDKADAKGASTCYAPLAQKGIDKYLLRVARERREGKNAI